MLAHNLRIGTILAAAIFLLGGAAPLRAEESTSPTRLRVMSYNIHHGRGTDGRIDLERIAEVIRKQDVDLVALQEVDIKTSRSSGIDQLAELARLTKMHPRFGKGRDFEGGDYGQGVLSRFPISSADVHVLPGDSEAEQRIALVAQISGEGPRPQLLFVGTHLHHQAEPLRLAQAQKLLEILQERKTRAAILVGDFNAEPDSKVMRHVLTTWDDTLPADVLTFPAGEPKKKIDWILLPKEHGWRVVKGYVVDEPVASDHLPIVAELEIKAPAAAK